MGKSLQLRVPPLVVVLLSAASMWALARFTAAFGRFSVAGQGWLAALLLLVGLALVVSGIVTFRNARTTVDPTHPKRAAHLVTGGIYRVTRNPMYMGMALWLLAWAVYLGSLLALLFLPLFVTYMNRFQIAPEERLLLRKFGGGYQRYRKRVRRWF